MATEKESKVSVEKVPVKTQPAHRLKITFDLRFTLRLIAGVVVIGVAVHFLHAYQVDRNASALLAKSKDAQSDGNLKEATQYLRAYIGFRPHDASAVADLAQLLDQQAGSVLALQQAYFTYQEALRQDSDRDELRHRIFEIALLLGRPDAALRQIEHLEKKNPSDLELSLLVAQCYFLNSDIDLAALKYAEVLSRDETNVEAYSRLANLFLSRYDDLPYQEEIEDLKSPPEISALFRSKSNQASTETEDVKVEDRAQFLLNRMVNLGEPKYLAYLERARSYLSKNELNKAEEDVKKALELAPHETDVLLASVDLALGQAKSAKESGKSNEFLSLLEQAELHSTEGLKLLSQSADFHLRLFRVQKLRGDLDSARQSLEDGLAAISQSLASADLQSRVSLQDSGKKLRLSLADLLISQSQLETGKDASDLLKEADALVKELEKLESSDPIVAYLQARLHFVRGEWLLAVPKFARSRNGVRNNKELRREIDVALGECYRQLKNPDRQILVFRQALEDDPFWMLARIGLARALAAADRLDDAIEAFQLTGNQPGASAEAAQLMFRRELRVPKEKRNWVNVLHRLQAEEALSLRLNLPVPSNVPILRADVLLQQGKRDEAKATLEQARVDHPDSASIVNAQVELMMSNSILDEQSRIQNVEKLLDEATQKLGDRVELRMARARIARELTPERAAETFASLAQNTDGFTSDERANFLQRLAQSYASVGDLDGAKKVWRQLANSNEHSIEARLALFQLAVEEQDETSKLKELEQIVKLEGPGGPYGNVIKAELLIRQSVPKDGVELTSEQRSSLIQARKLLQRVSSQRSSWSVISRLLGDVGRLLGNEDVAVEHYFRAVENGDRSKFVVEYIIQYLYLKKRYDEADQLIQDTSENAPQLLTGNTARLAWQVAFSQERYDRALGLAKDAAEETRDFRDKLWLSYLMYVQGKRGKPAETPLREATHDFPHEPQVWLSLVSYLERVGRNEDAIAELEEARTILPDDPPYLKPLTLATGYEVLSDLQKAEHYYLQALETDSESANLQFKVVDFYTRNGLYGKADPYIDSLLNSTREVPEALRELARSRRARIIASSRIYADVQRALQSLGSSNATVTLFDLRTKSQILSTRSTKTDRREHVQVLNQIAEKGAIETLERLQLARLYEQIGEWEQSREEFELLLKDSPQANLVMIEYATALLRNNATEEARRWLDEARVLSPGSLLEVLLEARILHKVGKEQEARAIVGEFLADGDALSSSPAIVQELLTSNEGRALLPQFSEIIQAAGDPKLSEHFSAGAKFLEVGQAAQAVDEFLPLLENEQIGKSVRAYLTRKASRLFSELGDYSHAEKLLKSSMELAKQPSDQFEMISIFSRQNRVSEALDLCEELWGHFDEALVARTSVAVLRTGKPKQKEIQRVEARVTSEMAKSSNPEKFHLHLADLKDLKGEYPQAVALYSQAMRTDNNNLVALNNYAYISILVGENSNQALKAITQAIRIAGPVGSFLDTRGVIHLKDGNLKQAIKDLTYAIDENASLSTQFRLSQAYWEQGDKIKAREIFEKAQKAGLSVQSVHPLEREEYEQLEKKLEIES